MFLGSRDIFHQAEKISGPQDMMKRGIMIEKITYQAQTPVPNVFSNCVVLLPLNMSLTSNSIAVLAYSKQSVRYCWRSPVMEASVGLFPVVSMLLSNVHSI